MIQEIWTSASAMLAENQFLSGGLLLGMLTGLIVYFKQVPNKIWRLFLSQFTVIVTFHNSEFIFEWLQHWLAEQDHLQKARRLVVNGSESGSKEGADQALFSPAPGLHWLRYKNKWMQLTVERGESSTGTYQLLMEESYSIRIFGRSRQPIEDLLIEAFQTTFPDETAVRIWTESATWDHWILLGKQDPRGLETVILPENMIETTVKDMKRFLSAGEWYKERCVPYRRGYLLHGTPGTGKSSLVHALASEFDKDVYSISLGSKQASAYAFTRLLRTANKGSIILIEDVDCIGKKRVVADNKDSTKPSEPENTLTMSALLNCIDGIAANTGNMLFLTTNYPEKLDPALMRSGRIDFRIEFKPATKEQAQRFFVRFYPKEKELAQQFAEAMPKGVVMADIQNHMINYCEDPKKAVENISEMHCSVFKAKEEAD